MMSYIYLLEIGENSKKKDLSKGAKEGVKAPQGRGQ
jgi:hypothetical protein